MKVESAALLGLEPALDSSTFVRAVVVQDEVNLQVRWHFLFQLMEEFDEFPAPVTRQATANDLPVQDVESGKFLLTLVRVNVCPSFSRAIPLRRCSRTTSQLRFDGVVPLGQGFMALQSQ
jgi:hypothetical protein